MKAVRIVFKNSFGRLFTVNLCDGVYIDTVPEHGQGVMLQD